MLRLSRWIGFLTVVLCVSVAFAQQRPGGGRPGGFGGGFGGPSSSLTLAGNEAVQKELGLIEEQVKKIKALDDDARREMLSAFGGFNFQELRDLPEEDRRKKIDESRAKMAEATKKVNDKIQPKLKEILDATQRERLQQIGWQVAGTQALQDADLAAALKLSDDQKKDLADIAKEFADKQAELFGGGRGGSGAGGGERRGSGAGDFEERFTKVRELSESRDKQVSEVLTDAQREQLEKLKGKPFDVAQLRGGFGGGRGGFGGPGGPNPNGRPQRRPQSREKTDEKKSGK